MAWNIYDFNRDFCDAGHIMNAFYIQALIFQKQKATGMRSARLLPVNKNHISVLI